MVGDKAHRIFIVEDERDVATLLAAVLEDEGYEVRLFHHGDCCDQILEYDPAVVLCDYQLPICDGQHLLRKLRSGSASHIGVILISAMGRARDNWYTWGADAFVPKPFDLDDLLLTIERTIAARDMRRLRQTEGRFEHQRAS